MWQQGARRELGGCVGAALKATPRRPPVACGRIARAEATAPCPPPPLRGLGARARALRACAAAAAVGVKGLRLKGARPPPPPLQGSRGRGSRRRAPRRRPGRVRPLARVDIHVAQAQGGGLAGSHLGGVRAVGGGWGGWRGVFRDGRLPGGSVKPARSVTCPPRPWPRPSPRPSSPPHLFVVEDDPPRPLAHVRHVVPARGAAAHVGDHPNQHVAPGTVHQAGLGGGGWGGIGEGWGGVG
jgi:hypothetical protein